MNEADPMPPDITILNSDRNGVILEISLNGVYVEEMEINGDVFHQITITEYGDEVNEDGCTIEVLKMEVPVEEEVIYIESVDSEVEYVLRRDNMTGNLIYTDNNLYCFQVSSWKRESIAEREVEKLKRRGIKAVMHKMYVPEKGAVWCRVRVGYFSTRDEANAYRAQNFRKIFLTNDKAYYQYKR